MEFNQKGFKIEYIKRINNVIDFIEQHYSESLTLEKLAEISHFSPFHFHRIFKGITGESLNKYVNRSRLEKAAWRLMHFKDESIAEISLNCGFSQQSSFSRAFKSYFNMSATDWRKGGHSKFSKNSNVESKKWKDVKISPMYINSSTTNCNWRISMIKKSDVIIQVKELEPVPIAYIRNIGPSNGQQETWARIFNKLIQWGGARNLIKCPGTDYFTVFRDSHEITDFSNFKSDLSMSVPAGTKGNGEVGISTIPGGKYAVAQFEIDASEYQLAWDLVYSEWLPNSGFQPDDRYCFEKYLNDPKMHPQGKHFIEVYIPVRAL